MNRSHVSLEPGTVLGPYQVNARIGEGRRDEIRHAHDRRLNWDVTLLGSLAHEGHWRQHFLNLRPLPHGHGEFRPNFG